MPLFLNTQKLNEWIPKLINETEKELVLIVPYIKTSNRIYNELYEVNKRGVETTIVYRENKLNDFEKAKLESLDNLNLMHHPNIHCKCYYNEKYLIVSSINLYEYSEKNNREMGILISKNSLNPDAIIRNGDDEQVFKDVIDEIKEIMNGSHMEKKSRETLTEGFELEIIKTEKEKVAEVCTTLNRFFANKKFEPVLWGNKWRAVCSNYFDKIDVHIDYRLEFHFKLPDDKLEETFNRFIPFYHEYRIQGFKMYWNHHSAPLYLYLDSKHPNLITSDEKMIIEFRKQGIDELISFMRKFL